jgi:hypothetical protein
MLAPVASQTAERALMEEIRCRIERDHGATERCVEGELKGETNLREHGVSGKLGKLRRPETDGQNLFLTVSSN